jgi:hypothetical protein
MYEKQLVAKKGKSGHKHTDESQSEGDPWGAPPPECRCAPGAETKNVFGADAG